MTQWEYFSIPVDGIDVVEFDRYGAAGWELVTIYELQGDNRHEAVFKRPKNDKKDGDT